MSIERHVTGHASHHEARCRGEGVNVMTLDSLIGVIGDRLSGRCRIVLVGLVTLSVGIGRRPALDMWYV